MAFQLKVSNSLDKLAEELCVNLSNNKQDVFHPIYIVTQTEGMNNWLKLQLAAKMGIAANINFLKPNDLINKIYYLLDGNKKELLSAENIKWLLFKLLGDEDFVQKFPSISGYYKNDAIDKDVKRMALAEKVSDLFDQYQIYRPDMIDQWNNNLPTNTNDDEWQRELWLKAKKITDKFPDKTTIAKEIEKGLADPILKERLQKKMPTIYLFGISLITEYHVQIFHLLADSININFLLLNPAPSVYWFDDKSEKLLAFLKTLGRVENSATNMGNPLLIGWGKIIQDTFSLLFKNDNTLNTYEDIETIAPIEDNLLHKIQYSIFENLPNIKETSFSIAEILDGSITINSCYTPAREVEVLYNFLVHLIDKKQAQLSPQDIVVMVSDIDQYASFIKAIFDNAPYKFKYTIADESYAASDSIFNALHAVLSITEDNFTAEEVVRLLDASFICNRFNITDRAKIRQVVDEANIRSGIDGNKEDDSVYISWHYGLQRIMYGICIAGGEEFSLGETDSFYPLDSIEGNTSNDVIRFVHFAEQLIEALKERKQPKTIGGWVEYVEDILHNFICESEETTDEDYLLLLKQLESYTSLIDIFNEEVSYEVFMHTFLATLTNATKINSFAVGGITFCSLIPMRSIPFKVVALLGLNFDKFPRKETIVGFNLMEKQKRKGDRNVKENDKHLFLETVLSAKDYLYISYIGQSVKDNTTIPPSTLIDELVEYISSNCVAEKNVRTQIITCQPLHGFSQQYNGENNKLYSYLQATKPALEILQTEKPTEPILFYEIDLKNLITFLQNPIEGYYKNVLGIYYADEETILNDTELFELDKLQQWGLKDSLVNITDTEAISNFKEKLVKTGELPLKNMADVEIQHAELIVTPVRTLLESLVGIEPKQNLFIDFEIGLYKLKGAVSGIYGNKLVVISWSKMDEKSLLKAYIIYLVTLAAGKNFKLFFISAKNEKIFEGEKMSPEMAKEKLKELLELYVDGHKKTMAFSIKFNIKPSDVESLSNGKLNTKIEAAMDKDKYLNKAYATKFFGAETILNDYKLVAEKLLIPLATIFPDYNFNA